MFKDVQKLYNKFGMHSEEKNNELCQLSEAELLKRAELILEEFNEFLEASGLRLTTTGKLTKAPGTSQLLHDQADSLVDLCYVVLGTAVVMGLPWEDLWNEVQRANSEKQLGIGPRGWSGDLVKPPGWKGPDINEVLLVTRGRTEWFKA
jgi:predicted HAD superfamily Cof-like phosphohydrolase